MKRLSGNVSEQKNNIFSDEQAVLGLPLRLTVSLIIGIIALAAIVSFISRPCLFPENMIISINPLVASIPSSNSTVVTFIFFVNDSSSHPIQGAVVILKGLGGAGSNITDNQGKTSIQIQVKIPEGSLEGYLDGQVKAVCYNPFSQNDMIKIIKKSR